MSQNSWGADTPPAPAKEIYITALAARKHAARKTPTPPLSLPAISWASGKIWEHALRPARLRAGLPHVTAGRGMAAEVRQDTRNRRGLTVAGSPGKPLPRRVSRGAGYLFWRAPGAALERRHDGGAAVPSGDLTLMSLDADAHVMTRLSDPPHTDKSVIFHPR